MAVQEHAHEQADRRGTGWLTAAAAASFGLAVLHLIIVFVGLPAYVYFTAPQRLIDLAREGSAEPALITMIIALVFTVFGFYALSGAGRAPTLPVLRLALVGISGVFLLRGLLIVPQLLMFLNTDEVPARGLAFSAVALGIGVCYTVGSARRWPLLPISIFERSPV
jgi:hypothetical protein